MEHFLNKVEKSFENTIIPCLKETLLFRDKDICTLNKTIIIIEQEDDLNAEKVAVKIAKEIMKSISDYGNNVYDVAGQKVKNINVKLGDYDLSLTKDSKRVNIRMNYQLKMHIETEQENVLETSQNSTTVEEIANNVLNKHLKAFEELSK